MKNQSVTSNLDWISVAIYIILVILSFILNLDLTTLKQTDIQNIDVGDLILVYNDGTELNAGHVVGPAGPQGPERNHAEPGSSFFFFFDFFFFFFFQPPRWGDVGRR